MAPPQKQCINCKALNFWRKKVCGDCNECEKFTPFTKVSDTAIQVAEEDDSSNEDEEVPEVPAESDDSSEGDDDGDDRDDSSSESDDGESSDKHSKRNRRDREKRAAARQNINNNDLGVVSSYIPGARSPVHVLSVGPPSVGDIADTKMLLSFAPVRHTKPLVHYLSWQKTRQTP